MWIYDFFKFLFIYFNWRIITLLWWFCCISTWIGHRYTCVYPPSWTPLPPPSPPYPSGLSQSTGFRKSNFSLPASWLLSTEEAPPTVSSESGGCHGWTVGGALALPEVWQPRASGTSAAGTPASAVRGWLPTFTDKAEPNPPFLS